MRICLIIVGLCFVWFFSRPSIKMTFLNGKTNYENSYRLINQYANRVDGSVNKGKSKSLYYRYYSNKAPFEYVSILFGQYFEIYDGKSAKIIVDNDRNVVSFKEYKKPTWFYRGGYLALVALYLLWCLRHKKLKTGGMKLNADN